MGIKRIRNLMDYMGLVPMTPGPHTSKPHPNHKKYPYLLRGPSITRLNQVWAIDITYIRLAHGLVYMTVVVDWFSRYVIAWELSPTLDNEFCVHCTEEVFRSGYKPDIFNSDQGSHFTSKEFISILERESVRPRT